MLEANYSKTEEIFRNLNEPKTDPEIPSSVFTLPNYMINQMMV